MSSCKIDYIEQLDWLESQEAQDYKTKLYNTLSDLAKKVRSPKIFNYYDNRFKLPKSSSKYRSALELFESLNQNYEFVSFVEDPNDPTQYNVKIDVVTPFLGDIKKYLKDPSIKIQDIALEDMLNIENSLFGFTKLSQESGSLKDTLNQNLSKIAEPVEKWIDKMSNTLAGVIQEIGKDSRFNTNYGSELIDNLNYYRSQNKEMSQKAVRYFFDTATRLKFFKETILNDSKGVQESLKIINEIDINSPNVTEEEKISYKRNSQKIAEILKDAESYEKYFQYMSDFKTILENNGIVSNPFERYDGVRLEESLIDLLKTNSFSEIESLEILEEVLNYNIKSIDNFIPQFINSVLNRNKEIDGRALEGNLLAILEDTIKKDKDGNALSKTVTEQLIELTDDYSKIKNQLKVLQVEWLSKTLYDELASGNYKDLSIEKVRQIIKNDQNQDSILNKWLGSVHQMNDEFLQFAGKKIRDHVIEANNKKLDIESSFESLEKMSDSARQLIQDNFATEKLYLPKGEDLIYLDLEDSNPDSKIVTIGGKQFRVLLKRNQFINQEYDYAEAALNKKIFQENLQEFNRDFFEELTATNSNNVFQHKDGWYGIEQAALIEITQNLRNKLQFEKINITSAIKENLFKYFQNNSELNRNKLEEAINKSLFASYFNENSQERSFEEKEQVLEKAGVGILFNSIDSADQQQTLKNFEKYYTNSEILYSEFVSDKELENRLQFVTGVENEDGAGYILTLTSENKLEQLAYSGDKGSREFDFSSLNGIPVKFYNLNWKFQKPSDKYLNQNYKLLQDNSTTKNIQDKLLNYYKVANSQTEAELQYGLVPQVLKEEVEEKLLKKLQDPKKLYQDLRNNIINDLRFEVVDIDDVTQIIKAKKNYTYTVEQENEDGSFSPTTYQVEVGDLVNIRGHLILDENGNKELDEQKGARKSLFGLDVNGDEIKRINKKYTKLLDSENLETDIFKMLKKFAVHAVEYNELKKASIEGSLLLNVLKDRTVIQKYKDKKGVLQEVTDVFGRKFEKQVFGKLKILEGYIDTNIYGRSLDKQTVSFLGKDYDLHSAVNKLSSVIAFQSLAFNIVAPIGNMTIGTMNNLLMSLQGKVLDSETYNKANAFYWKSMAKGSYTDIFANQVNAKSMLGQTLQKFQAIQGLDYDVTKKQNPFGFRWLAYLSSSLPEYNLQGTLAIGILMKEDFKGRKVFDILTDLYKESQDNESSYHDLITNYFGSDFVKDLTNKIQSANTKAHGNYIKGNQAQLQRIAVFSLALMFKKWIWSGFLNRYQKEHYNFLDKDYETGYHRVFLENLYKGLLDDFQNPEITGWKKVSNFVTTLGKGKLKTAAHIGNVVSSAVTLGNFKLSDIDAYREYLYDESIGESEQKEMFRAASELTIFLSALILSGVLYGLGKGEDGEDDNAALLTASYYLTRLQFDSGFFLPYTTVPAPGGIGALNSWDNAWRIIQDPLTVERTLENNIGLLGQIIGFYEDEEGYTKLKLFEQYKTSGNSYQAGDYKIIKKLKKSIFSPVYQIERFINIEDQIRYLDMVQSTSK